MFTATLVLTVLGFSLGALLGYAAKLISVDDGNSLADEIEALLPGSQCGQCGLPGCRPAAEAISNGEAPVTCCPPGGRALAEALAERLGIDINTLGETPVPMLATIEESLCTGCTRCYKICPTDAIVGSIKQIHAVIKGACTGCAKCQEACPEDCISLAPQAVDLNSWHWPKPDLV